jgi:hypothetical protein
MKLGAELLQYWSKIMQEIPGWKEVSVIVGIDNETNFSRLARKSFDQIEDRWQRNCAIEVNNIFVKCGVSYLYYFSGVIHPSDPPSTALWEGSVLQAV